MVESSSRGIRVGESASRVTIAGINVRFVNYAIRFFGGAFYFGWIAHDRAGELGALLEDGWWW